MAKPVTKQPLYNTPETIGPDRATPGIQICNILLCTAALTIVSLRLYTRIWIKAAAGWDDWLIIGAMVLGLAFIAPQFIEIYMGKFGHHRYLLTQNQINYDGSMNIATNVLSAFSLAFSRASIIVLLLRIIGTIRRWVWALWIAMGLNWAVAVGTTIMYCILCIPIEKEWNQAIPGHCMNKKAFDDIVKMFTAMSCVVDFMCATIPFVAMQHVQIDKRTKIGLFAILGCGLVTASCGIGRAVALNFSSKDIQWELVPLIYWQMAEMYGAIIFASLPALRQLYSHVTKYHTFRRAHKTSYANSNSAYGTRTKQASTPNTLSDPTMSSSSRSNGGGNVGRYEVGKQTDVYVELNDLENGRQETLRRGQMSPPLPRFGGDDQTVPQYLRRGESFEHLRTGR